MPKMKNRSYPILVALAGCIAGACAQPQDPETAQAHSALVSLNPPNTYVQLFKWRWNDIASECTKFLGPNGFGAVQISPPQAHITTNAWWNIYQPVNYRGLVGDMGNATALQNMITTCHNAGVRIYADVVFNQMAGGSGTATDGSSYNGNTPQYPYFGVNDFHSACSIQSSDYNSNRNNVVNCRLVGLPDVATDSTYARGQIAQYLTTLVNMGVDGFRIDAAKHMWPADIQAILAQVPKTTLLGESVFITQEVIPDGTANRSDYLINGTINEFPFTYAVRDTFRNNNGLNISQLPTVMGTGNGGGSWGLVSSANATIFVDNHDTERNSGDSLNLQSDNNKRFDLANIYMLAQPYGRAQLQSGFTFSLSNTDQNSPSASPYDANGNAIIMGAWDFVHRWGDIYPMVAFRNATAGQPMANIQTGTGNQLAFSRGNVGFVALNNDTASWTKTFATGLPAGTYCNIVHGLLASGGASCTSDSVTVDSSGNATVTIGGVGGSTAPAVAIYTGQKASSTPTVPPTPTGVTATAVSSSSISVSWAASSGATSYTVSQSTSSTGTFTNVGTSSTTSFTQTGLAASTTYYYKVTASNSAGTSASSAVASATTSAAGSCTSGFCPTKTPVDYDATLLVRGQSVVIYYKGTLANGSAVNIHYGFNNWATGVADAAMTKRSDGYWQSPAIALSSTTTEFDFVFNNGSGTWDNNSGSDWKLAVSSGTSCSTVSVTFSIANANTVTGQNLYVVGNQAALGNWTPASGFALTIQGTGANATWSGTVQLPPNTAFQYKYVKYNPSTAQVVWESNQTTTSGNREKTTAACGSSSSFSDGNFKL
ncbi:carbohydrate-binding module family 20 domain-containing protein [Hyalangium versicolor]|uniref:carbohydrate-binding module family 20 domain-containing protein n=1 Tax=Hyalangium versicolor TaxID=2861190 RepID=UPI001CCF3D69|nr:carbohydrate-binding module family 20 domain-containing protein [Hyalangium versicolor]